MDNNAIAFLERIKKKQIERLLPYQLTFELTPLCNFKCDMCYIRLDKAEQERIKPLLSANDWISIAKEAYDAGAVYLAFTGGEVFTRQDFRQIYEACYDMGYYIAILSNGYLMDDTIFTWLERKKPFLIKFTLYGASNTTYEQLCGAKNGFDIVTKNILKTKKIGITTALCSTVVKKNESDLPEIKRWAKENEIPFVYSTMIKNPVRGASRDVKNTRIFNTSEYIDMYKPIAQKKICDFGPFTNCRSYKNSCIIGWNGKMIGCNFINSISEELEKESFADCFRKLWLRLDKLTFSEKCQKCSSLQKCAPCPGECEGETGNPMQVNDYLCKKIALRNVDCI